jgi:FkbM family methyltransferase
VTDWARAVKTPVVVVAGAGQGYPVERWRGCWPGAAYHLFEVVPGYLAQLWKRYGGDPRVSITARALSDASGPLEFYLNDLPYTSGRYPFNRQSWAFAPQWGGETRGQVVSITLDGYCAERGIERIGFMELDVQGGELAALKGAAGLLTAGRIEALMVEVFYTDLYHGAPLADEVEGYLAALGYVAVGSDGECEHMRDITFVRGQA